MRKLSILIVPILALALAACGDDDTTATTGAESSAETTMTDGGGDEDMDGGADATTAGEVTIGAETWVFVPDIQCSVWPDDTINIAGSAEMDSEVEIVFDRFDDGSQDLRVSGPDFTWMATTDDFDEVSVEGDTVSGSATMSRMIGGDTATATFEFRC